MKRAIVGVVAALTLFGGAMAQSVFTAADVQKARADARLVYPVGFFDLAIWKRVVLLAEAVTQAEPNNPQSWRLLAEVYGEVNWPIKAWEAWDQYRKLGGTWGAQERNAAISTALTLSFYAVQRDDLEDARRWVEQAAALQAR